MPEALSIIQRLKITSELQKLSRERDDLKPGSLKVAQVTGQLLALLRRLGEGAPSGDADDELSDDPNAANYRYADTGHIAGSRKELAKELIRDAKANGRQVFFTDLDWDEIEKNPRAAAELIVKSNLFGSTDWDGLKAGGMSAGAAFLIDRIYAAIGLQPAENTARSRQDYAVALKTIRERLEGCKEPKDVTDVLDAIKDELNGTQLNADESQVYEALGAQVNELYEQWQALKKEREALSKLSFAAGQEVSEAKWEQDKRLRRKWAPDAALQAKIDAAKPKQDAAIAAVVAWDAAHPEYADQYTSFSVQGGSGTRLSGGLRGQMTELRGKQEEITRGAKIRNVMESALTRGWLTFGERFFKLIHFRSYKGSDSFAGHVANARNDRIDWSWADKEPKVIKKATKQQINFQLKVAETFERIGGTPVKVESTLALKEMLGFRDVQSGNWVLKDRDSARFHVEQTAAAMLDLSDLTGIAPADLGLGGRLGMAFGARGTGNTGFGGAAKAHYEPVQRVINLTKMGGGGSLGHEWFHAIDDTLGELATGKPSSAKNYATVNPEVLPEGILRTAMQALRSVMKAGDVRIGEVIRFKESDRATAKHNIDVYTSSRVGQLVKAAGEAGKAVIAVDAYFAGSRVRNAEKARKQWRSLAAAYYAPAGDTEIYARTGPAGSSFYAEAVILDGGVAGKYWSKDVELAARAFQSWCEDRLQDQARKSDYLSSFADNKFHKDPLFGIEWKPYPEGEERKRINAAFDKVFAALREQKVFEKASSDPKLLDAIFGARAELSPVQKRVALMETNAELLILVRERVLLDGASPGFTEAVGKNTALIESLLVRAKAA